MSFLEGLLWLTFNIYHESRGEPFKGQLAVAHVTLQRANGELKNVRSVVSKPYQFSWTWLYNGKRDKKLFRQATWYSNNFVLPKKMYPSFGTAILSIFIKDKNKCKFYRRLDYHRSSWGCLDWKTIKGSEHVFCKGKDVIKGVIKGGQM
jgi:spore germination cell wall hydrolase CwlJ-like protein